MEKPNFINDNVEEALSFMNSKAKLTQTFSGVDIRCVMYLPLYTRGKVESPARESIKVFADLQTLSISSTRSVSPVRILGRSSPLTFTRGARTFAGTLVFASINKDAFSDVYDVDLAESYVNSSTSIVSDQLPPFSIVLTASNESGGIATQYIHGVTLVNYGTTYSIDNLYTETTYSYVATDISPMISNQARTKIDSPTNARYKTVGQQMAETLRSQYASSDKKALFDKMVTNIITGL